ncbi:MAG: STN domain-containing protein, partial [Deltaproteobacteria bacterium]|nr:STN domain-containing protein [Deltaproteobacteria bacterium]
MSAVALAAALLCLAAAPPPPEAPTPPVPPPAVAAPVPVPAQPSTPPAEAMPGSNPAQASSVLRGDWPADAPRIKVDFNDVRTRAAIGQIAEAAHWSISFKGKPSGRVDATFNDVPADEALAAILRDHGLVAERRGSIITITEAGQSPSEGDEHVNVNLRLGHAGDRTQVGGSVKVAEGETVQSAVAVGGSVEVDGTVLQDAVAVGGSVKLGPKAVVNGDAVSIGGGLDV